MISPLVSVVIPAYNAAKYISETIDSVLNQTYANFEIIIVNDGSTDETLAILNSIQKKDDRIVIFDKKNTGVSDTRNFGISKANGEFIAFLDADDYWLKENLESKIKHLTSENIDYIFSDVYRCDENLKILSLADKGIGEEILDNILLWKSEVIPFPCSNLIVSSHCFKNSELLFHNDLSNLADQHFCVLLAKKYIGFYLEEPLWLYRVLPNSMSKSLNLLEKDAIRAYEIYSSIGVFKSFWFKQKCHSNMRLMLGLSWYVNGKKKSKAFKHIIVSFIYNPFIVKDIISKFIKKIV